MKNKYIPGVCNIGKEEMLFRRNSGLVGIVLAVLFCIIIITFNLTTIYKLVIFLPVFLSTISLMQYKMHFCAELGILGKYNFSDRIGNTLSVEQKEYLKLDRLKALRIVVYSLMISLVITLTVVVLL